MAQESTGPEMSVLESQMVELMKKLQASEERQERSDALLRELLSSRDDAQRRGHEAPAGAEEVEDGGAEAAATSSRRETVAGEQGVPRSSDSPTADMVSSGGFLSVHDFTMSPREVCHVKSGVPKFDGWDRSFPLFQFKFVEFSIQIGCLPRFPG